MPQAQKIALAELWEIEWTEGREEAEKVGSEPRIKVQFNPQSLKVTATNQQSGERPGVPVQFVGRGTTKLDVDLLFDATVPQPDGKSVDDVRKLTKEVFYFMETLEEAEDDKFVPPGVRFLWGSFLFDGVMDSMNETLDFFSSDGRPLRSTVTISISKQELKFRFNPDFSPTPGAKPQTPARSGDSVQQIAARAGKLGDWKGIASANGIENPRLLVSGQRLDLNPPKVSISGPSIRAGVRGPGIKTG